MIALGIFGWDVTISWAWYLGADGWVNLILLRYRLRPGASSDGVTSITDAVLDLRLPLFHVLVCLQRRR